MRVLGPAGSKPRMGLFLNRPRMRERETKEMSKVRILGVTFFAVLALGAIAAASASATNEWLVAGKLVGLTEKVSVVVEGTWLLLGLSFFGSVQTHILCNGKLFGTVNGLNASGRGTDTQTSIEDLKGKKGTIECEVLSGGGCATTKPAFLTALNLPYETELLNGPKDMFRSTISGKKNGFKIECTLSNGSSTFEECEGLVETNTLTNSGNGTVTGEIPETNTETCKGFANEAHVKGTGVIKTLNATSIAIS
jgi:hypothetical protein